MANYYTSRHDLKQLSIGVPIHPVIRIKPNPGNIREDLRIHGDRISLLDVNNRTREEYECSDIFDGTQPQHRMLEQILPGYTRAVLDGVNVSFMAIGTTGTGKTLNIDGEGSEAGIINYIVQGVFEALEEKKHRTSQSHTGETFTYSVKMRYLEIVDEEIHDLLVHSNSRRGSLQVVFDEWEGPSVANASWIPCSSGTHLVDTFTAANRNRVKSVSEFGPLHEKATSICTLEILQVGEDRGETSVLASRVNFIDTPGWEKLNEDPETLRIREGNTMNKGILALGELIRNIANGGGDYVNYSASIATNLMKDIIGGNSLTVAMVCLQNGDMLGSSLVLNYMRNLQRVNNFPVINDSRQIGLLRKYRVEVLNLTNQVVSTTLGGPEGHTQQVAELEKQIVQNNLEKLKFADEKEEVQQKIREVKEGYNNLVREKAELQEELIRSEEERLQVSRALVELQIENAKLLETKADSDYDVNSKVLSAENEILAANMKEEKALEAINEVQDKLKKALDEKREIEVEFVALKTNYLNLSKELQEEKVKNENLSIELINLVNSNKALSGNTENLSKTKDNITKEQQKLVQENHHLLTQKEETQKALNEAYSKIDNLKSELMKYELNFQKQQIEFDNKKLEIERYYIETLRQREAQQGSRQGFKGYQQQYESEDASGLKRQLKIAQRRITELEDDLEETRKHDSNMTEECQKLQGQLEEMRSNFRGKIMKALNESKPNDQTLRTAREELINNYNQREAQLTQDLNREIYQNAQNTKMIRGLRNYARSLKNLAEDWAPRGEPLPQILVMPPSVLLEEQDLSSRSQNQELQKLRERNTKLEQELYTVKTQGSQKNLQERILNEIDYLKGQPVSQSRPGSGNYNVDVLRKERNQLREENRKLNKQLRESSGKQTNQELHYEIERLRRRVQEYEQGFADISSTSSNPQYLQKKIRYLEEVLKKVEKERSELSVRATMAEEQLKNLQEHLNQSTLSYQKKISELKNALGQRNF